MSKMKLFVVKSLDGFTTRSNGDIDFIHQYASTNDYGFSQFLKTVDCVVFSQSHYNELESNGRLLEYGNIPCYILCKASFSIPTDKNIHLLIDRTMKTNGYVEHIRQLQNLYKNIWLAGDRHLITACFEQVLIDEITVVVLPLTIGHGQVVMLGSSKEYQWQIEEKESFDNQVLKVRYKKKES